MFGYFISREYVETRKYLLFLIYFTQKLDLLFLYDIHTTVYNQTIVDNRQYKFPGHHPKTYNSTKILIRRNLHCLLWQIVK